MLTFMSKPPGMRFLTTACAARRYSQYAQHNLPSSAGVSFRESSVATAACPVQHTGLFNLNVKHMHLNWHICI